MDKTPEMGESFAEAEIRISSVMDNICKKYSSKNILIVAHGGVALFIKKYFYGIKPEGICKTSSPKLRNRKIFGLK